MQEKEEIYEVRWTNKEEHILEGMKTIELKQELMKGKCGKINIRERELKEKEDKFEEMRKSKTKHMEEDNKILKYDQIQLKKYRRK